MLEVPNGLSILLRMVARCTSMTLLRRSVSPSHTSSRIVKRETTFPALAASRCRMSNSRVDSSIAV